MDISKLKEEIENGNVLNTFMIFNCENTFIAKQYYRAISHCLNKPIQYLESLDSYFNKSKNIFGELNNDNYLNVFYTEKLELHTNDLIGKKYLIVISKKIDKDTENIYSEYIVNVPEIENWHIKDYVYSVLPGIDIKYLDWLIDNCNNDINRVQNEIDKLICFDEIQRQTIFEDMLADNAFSDITNKTIFDFTNAIQKKDIESLKCIYDEINVMDVEDIGVVTILYKNFIKLLKVWGSRNPTPENTGLNSKQIYAIQKSAHVWTLQQLINIIKFLTNIDYQLKTGLLSNINIRDYIVMKLMFGV